MQSPEKDAVISNIQGLQESLRGLVARLTAAKTSYEQLKSENQILVKYIQNLKSTTAELKK